jgi:glycerol-3-phosphate dehydrogenase subunit C
MVRDMHPPLAVCDSETCRWQIATATGVETVHPIALIHRAYGLS